MPTSLQNDTNDPEHNRACFEMAANEGGIPPILSQKHHAQPSAFTLENLLRASRRQRRIMRSSTPNVCIVDLDVGFGKGDADSGRDRLQLIVIGDDRQRARSLP